MSLRNEPKEAMCFRFRWFDTLDCLPEAELRQMLKAIRAYAETGTAPEFTGIAAALWHEFQSCIDHDKEEYSVVCARNKANGSKGGRPKKQDGFCETQQNPENPVGFCETQQNPTEPKKPDLDLDKEKETSPTEMQRKRIFFETNADEKDEKDDNVIVLKPVDFTKWSREEFIGSVYAAIGKNEAYAEFREEFCRYWLEPDKKGRFRFALQKTWSTAGRLATWAKKAPPKFPARLPQASPVLSAAEQIRQLQEG